MTYPSDNTIRSLVDQLRRLGRKDAKTGTAPLDDLERRMLEAIHRDLAGSVRPDGYPAATMGGDGGSSRRSASSTERAAVALADPTTRLPRDVHRTLTLEALGRLLSAVEQVQAWRHRLEALRALTDDSAAIPATCEVCSGLRGPGSDRAVAHRGTVGDRLEAIMDLCDACYWFIVRSAKPNSRQGRLPTPAQIARHEERGYWRIAA